MLNKVLNKITFGRHFWRYASFSEVSQLYRARLMRVIAVNLGTAFISVYMLKAGYSVVSVSLFWACYFGVKVILAVPLAQVIASIGPKKAILYSNFTYIPSMVAFLFINQVGIYALVITAIFQATSASLYDMGHTISFSRIKGPGSVGKEVAMMGIFEKIAKGVTPLIGGLLALFFDPRASIAMSVLFFILAARPMMKTADSMKTGFKLAPKGFPWKVAGRSVLLQTPIGFDIYASGEAWSLFLAVLIFTSAGNRVYAELGLLTSFILLVSLASTYMYGKLIDKKAGAQLMFWSTIGKIFTTVARIFTRTPAMAVGTNAASEVTSTGYSMAIMRGVFDVADRTGYRVFYIGLTELMGSLGSCIGAVSLTLIIASLDTERGFMVFYTLTAGVVSLILLSRFRIYSRR